MVRLGGAHRGWCPRTPKAGAPRRSGGGPGGGGGGSQAGEKAGGDYSPPHGRHPKRTPRTAPHTGYPVAVISPRYNHLLLERRRGAALCLTSPSTPSNVQIPLHTARWRSSFSRSSNAVATVVVISVVHVPRSSSSFSAPRGGRTFPSVSSSSRPRPG